ncbi:MAG TPA: hypothetical protein HA260_00350, partial [Thermoplasmata archaeon]|nr:hypothetical protein [Thermoplasmata archaeon]
VLNGNSTNDTNLATSFYSTILRNKDFFFDFTQTGYHTGIVNSNNTYYIVSSTPILHSNNEGASDGTLIVGRYLDANKIQSFENITQLYIEAHPLSNSILKNAEKTLFTSYEKPVYCKPINSSYIAGYSIVDDLQGHPVFILEVGSNRAVYNQGVGMTQNLMIATLFIIAVFIILIILIIDRFVTAPLTKLTNSINEIREYRDLSKKFQAKGNDEIAVLENKIDTMLTWLSKAWMQKDKTELSLEKKVDELERFKKITIDREIRMVELKKQIDDLKSGVRDNREQPPEKA